MIPFVDLRAQYRAIKTEIDSALLEVLDDAQFVLGDAVSRFEAEFADYCGARHAVALNSGTSALHLALLTVGIGRGDEVITVPMTFVATVSAIIYAGAVPVFVDIDPDTWTMDPSRVEAAITKRTKAILPVHLHGQVAEMAPLLRIARHYGLTVIEDAAQAHGAEYHGRRAGGIGDIGCFSFYPSKNLGACGEGGALVTDDAGFAEHVRLLRDWGQAGKYNHVLKGYNYRMDGVQGAILGVKLRYLEQWTERRRGHAAYYEALLAGCGFQLPAARRECRHVYHVYAVGLRDRDAVQQHLAAAGIATSAHYPVPIHLQLAFADLGYGPGAFPVAERFASTTLSLPMFPELSGEQVARVCNVLKEVTNAYAG